MEIVKKVSGQTGRLPVEFCELFNYADTHMYLSDTDKTLIAFLEMNGGEYKDEFCHLILK